MQTSIAKTRYSALLRRDAVCDEFELQWRQGNRPRLESFLARISRQDERPALLRELLEIEIHYRRARGEVPCRDEYANRLPADVFESTDLAACLNAEPEGDVLARAGSTVLPTWIGKYRVLEWLGAGGQANVYRAVHPDLGLEVAIKWSRRALPRDADWGPQREGKVLVELNHSGLTKVYDLDLCDGRPFLVLEYVPGVSLDAFVQQTPLTSRRARELVAELAVATAFAHECGVVHHDIKPSNVLVQPDGRVRLIDFGLARIQRAWDADAHDGRIAGTPAFMAPEQARGQPADYRADIFGLGAVLYYLLAGRGPFEQGTYALCLEAAQRGVVDLSAANSGRRLRRVLRRALAELPGERQASAQQFARELGSLSARRGVALAIAVLAMASLSAALSAWNAGKGGFTGKAHNGPEGVPPWTALGVEQGLGQDICAGLSLDDLALMMSFDSANFIRTGDRTIVRDLSGQGRHGQAVRVSFAEKGKFGNALAMGPGGVEVAKALLDQHPEYTLSCWLYYVPQPMGGVFYSEFLSQDWDRGDTCMFSVREDRGVGIAVWNVANPVRWKLDHTPPGVVPERQWCFVAITLRNGGVDRGEVTVQVDDQRFVLASQQIRSNPPNFPARTSVVGANSALDRGFPGLLDHLWIFTRALSQEEIDLLRETGRPARREQP
ncbi:MAG: protein kinase [Pirellulales bacterium]